jgi:hypothetical protein
MGLEKVLPLPIWDEKKEWMPSKNLRRLIGAHKPYETSSNTEKSTPSSE